MILDLVLSLCWLAALHRVYLAVRRPRLWRVSFAVAVIALAIALTVDTHGAGLTEVYPHLDKLLDLLGPVPVGMDVAAGVVLGLKIKVIADVTTTMIALVAMLTNPLTALGAALAVSTTGVAGPGPADGVPAGRVFVAVAGADGPTQVHRLDLVGDRAEVREASTAHALLALLDRLP